MRKIKGVRSTVTVPVEFRKVFEDLKTKGYSFATIAATAIKEAIEADMPVPEKRVPKGHLTQKDDGEFLTIGVLIPLEVKDKLDKLTKPTGSKQAYIREAIIKWVDRNNI